MAFEFRKTYELETNAPPPMAWRDYAYRALDEYHSLINGPQRDDETAIHRFFELNPSFVPGAFSYPRSGHPPIFWGMYTKPKLSGEPLYIPDFLWLAAASDGIYPVFVEIETPAKRWFTKSGQPTAAWTQAADQIANWKQWLRNPAKLLAWTQSLQIPESYTRGYEMHPQFVLIYGSSAEFEERPELRAKRPEMETPNVRIMTFDSVVPDPRASPFLTIRREAGHNVAVTIPPTFELGPMTSQTILQVQGRIEAVERDTRMSEERRAFVIRRIPYWDEWMRLGSRGISSTGDFE
jgi:hypothetical protein